MTPKDTGESFLTWLRRHGQTDRAIERFWKTVLVSALNEDVERVSVPSAAQVMRESFLKSSTAGRMGIPTVPLTDLYQSAAEYIRVRGGDVQFRASVESFRAEFAGVDLCLANGDQRFDFVVFAVPFDVLSQILPATTAARSFAKSSAISKPRRSPAFICGSTARSPISIMRCCSTGRFSGCFISRSCWRPTRPR